MIIVISTIVMILLTAVLSFILMTMLLIVLSKIFHLEDDNKYLLLIGIISLINGGMMGGWLIGYNEWFVHREGKIYKLLAVADCQPEKYCLTTKDKKEKIKFSEIEKEKITEAEIKEGDNIMFTDGGSIVKIIK